MTRIPRISGNTMIKYLIKKNFVVSARKGSHVTLRCNRIPITIPAGNNKLKIGLLLAVLYKAEISKKQFVNDFNKELVK